MNKHSNKWIMKFRPEHVKDVIIPDCYRKFFNDIVAQKEIPNLMMYGKAGTGKSTMAEAIIRDTDAVVFAINTSLDGRVELLKEDLQKFARTRAPNGRPKIVYLDEFDGGSAAFQAGLRKLIEESAVNCSYLMTCNYPTKIIGPLHEGRTMEINFNFPEKEMQDSIREQVKRRVNGLLSKVEKVEFDEDVVNKFIDQKGNCIREIYSMLQKYYKIYGKIDSKLLSFSQVDGQLIDLIKQVKIEDARRLIIERGWSDVDVYRFLFDKYVPACSKKGSAILTIGQYELAGATSRLPDIQLACCLVSLAGLG